MADDANIKVEVEIPHWCAEALEKWAELERDVGDTIAEKLAFLAQEQAERVNAAWEEKGRETAAYLRQLQAEHDAAMDALFKPKRIH